MDSIYGLVSVWMKSRNGCGNNYVSQRFVRGLKKTCGCCFWQFWEMIKKRIDVHVGGILTCLGGD